VLYESEVFCESDVLSESGRVDYTLSLGFLT